MKLESRWIVVAGISLVCVFAVVAASVIRCPPPDPIETPSSNASEAAERLSDIKAAAESGAGSAAAYVNAGETDEEKRKRAAELLRELDR